MITIKIVIKEEALGVVTMGAVTVPDEFSTPSTKGELAVAHMMQSAIDTVAELLVADGAGTMVSGKDPVKDKLRAEELLAAGNKGGNN